MSRRPTAPPVGRINTARARMAPGGRMWSESPIVYPRRRVAMSGVPPIGGVPPDSLLLHNLAVNDVNPTTLPAFPEGITSAVVWICAVGTDGLDIPDGWRVLLTGVHGAWGTWTTPLRYALVAADVVTGDEDMTFTWVAAGPSYHKYTKGVAAYFSGGAGGYWEANVGPTTTNLAQATFADPLGVPWLQLGGLTGLYTYGTSPAGVHVDGGPAAQYTFPAPSGYPYTGAAFDAACGDTAVPYTGEDLITWTSSGVFGPGNSIPLAVSWHP